MRIAIDYLENHPSLTPVVADWLFREWFQAMGTSLAEAEDIVRWRARRHQLPLALVALAGGEAVGTASLAEDTLPEQWQYSPFLAGVYVVPRWRGWGIGAGLCRRALVEACRLGLDRLHLYTPGQEPFYARLGWTRIEDTLLSSGDTYQLVTLMEKSLRSNGVHEAILPGSSRSV